MKREQLDSRLAAANPVSSERARDLSIAAAQEDLVIAAMAEPQSPPTPGRAARAHRRRLVARGGVALAATALVLVALLTVRDDPGRQDAGTAWAAEQIRFANASPLVLLGAAGWRVEYADEHSDEEGQLQFRRGETPPRRDMTFDGAGPPVPADVNAAQLHWYVGGIARWHADRAASAVLETTAPVLGTTARVYQYDGGIPGHRDITALFRYDGRVLEFRAGAADVDSFKALLATLERVGTSEWLSALPASAVQVADRDATVERMLRGVTAPPGFDPKSIEGAELVKDRYQLGAAVVGAVACRWFERWSEARQAGDRAAERAATTALATARDWPILDEMAKKGGYPDVLLGYVAAMPSGVWHGRPLIGDVDSGLGCAGLGVDLP